jgi:hypothetical protein
MRHSPDAVDRHAESRHSEPQQGLLGQALSWASGETIAIAASRKLGFAPAKQVKDALAG